MVCNMLINLALLLPPFLFPLMVQAYLDPGTLSYFVQIVVAALAGVAYAVKVFWGSIKIAIAKFFSRTSKNNNEKSGSGNS